MSLIVIAIGCKGKTGERNREREGGMFYITYQEYMCGMYMLQLAKIITENKHKILNIQRKRLRILSMCE